MIYKHLTQLPQAYDLDRRGDGYVDIWLCRQIDTYVTPGGIREYDVDVRVIFGVDDTPGLEADVRMNWETWWAAATTPDP